MLGSLTCTVLVTSLADFPCILPRCIHGACKVWPRVHKQEWVKGPSIIIDLLHEEKKFHIWVGQEEFRFEND